MDDIWKELFGKYFDKQIVSEIDKKESNTTKDETEFDVNQPTAGDYVGMVGSSFSDVSTTLTTLMDRIGDKNRTNPFFNYGEKAIGKLEENKSYARQIFDLFGDDISLATRTAMNSVDENSRGTNTTFAKKASIFESGLKTKKRSYADFLTRLMQTNREEANILKRRDFLSGTTQRNIDELDRQDTDNFYTQLGINLSNIGTSIEKQGADMNSKKSQDIVLDMFKNMSSMYDVTHDKDGKIIFTPKKG